MTVEYSIDENDFLTHQLYIVTKSDRIKRKRKWNQIICPFVYVAFGILLVFLHLFWVAVAFILFGLGWYITYPIWERWHYVRHYKGFIKENYKDRFNKPIIVELDNDFILAKDKGNESKILTTEIEEINEIPTMILLKLRSGVSFIFPKDKIKDIDLLIARLKELAIYLNISYNIDDQWKWK